MLAMFRSLGQRNYRIWFVGSLASNVGTWMQRTAQSWIVLTELTDYDATALGVVTALQFIPQLAFAPFSGIIADRFPKRAVLMWTQSLMGFLALGLGLLVVFNIAELWHVYVFALLLGIVATVDAPARQSFVSEVVGAGLISNAVALNAASFNGARMFGPAVAGVLTVVIGAGPVFLVNAVTFISMILALWLMREDELLPAPPARGGRGQIRAGWRYVAKRPDIIAVFCLVFLLGSFGMNFPIYSATISTIEFGLDADAFGLLNSMLAIGTLTGALLSARRARARFRVLLIASVAFGVCCMLAAASPTYWVFAVAIIPFGLCSMTALTTANALVQDRIDPTMRGRVMSLYMAILLGGTPIGAPVLGWLVDEVGPRFAMGIGALSGPLGALIAFLVLRRAGATSFSELRWWMRSPKKEPRPDLGDQRSADV